LVNKFIKNIFKFLVRIIRILKIFCLENNLSVWSPSPRQNFNNFNSSPPPNLMIVTHFEAVIPIIRG